jgi:glyoxylase-like metal-dependent hydrolase (beta-lactamase superfamily II)
MQLEDHLGDVLRKARKMSDVAAPAAAAAAGLTESELAALEKSGQSAKPVDFLALGQLLGLHPQKLRHFAEGWRPAPQNLNRWQELRMFATTAEDLTVNAFLVWDKAAREAALFDTGVDAGPVLACLASGGLKLAHIFITHSHWDHVETLPQIRKAFPAAQLHVGSPAAPQSQRLAPGEIFTCGQISISFRETPGHAEDGVTYLINGWPGKVPTVAVVGDTILAGSMCNGNGQWTLARQKIREEILSLSPETLLCPGHGPVTTVGEERKHNPFF